MTQAVLGLTAAMAALGALLLNLGLRSPWSWRVKAAAVSVSFATVVAGYFALVSLMGRPTPLTLPVDAELLHAVVHEPSARGADAGAIYIWARPLDDPAAAPRAYELPYDRGLHEDLAAALVQLAQGTRQGTRPLAPSAQQTERRGGGRSLQFFALERRLPQKR